MLKLVASISTLIEAVITDIVIIIAGMLLEDPIGGRVDDDRCYASSHVRGGGVSPLCCLAARGVGGAWV